MRSLFALIILSVSVHAADIKTDLQQLNNPGPEISCPSCSQPLSHEKSNQLTDINGDKLELSVLSLDEANGFVKEFLAITSIPFDYALDGCFARAHKMAKILEEKGISSGKAFLMGRLFAKTKYGPVSWRYHVAPIVLIKTGDGVKPFIIDPALFDHAIPYEEWKNYVSGVMPNGRRNGPAPIEYFTNRFVYDPTSSREKRTEFFPGDLADTDATLARLMEIKRQLDSRVN